MKESETKTVKLIVKTSEETLKAFERYIKKYPDAIVSIDSESRFGIKDENENE